MSKEIRIPKGKKSCNRCSAPGLFWRQSERGSWVLWEIIEIENAETDEPGFSFEQPHFKSCGDPEVGQVAPKPAAPEIDAETRDAIHTAIRIVAEACDGALRHDGQGFSKFDSRFGNSLANADSLSNNMAKAGKRMIKKYARQLDAAGFDTKRLN